MRINSLMLAIGYQYKSCMRKRFPLRWRKALIPNCTRHLCFARNLAIGFLLFAMAYAIHGLQRSYGHDLNSKPVTSLTVPGAKEVVLFFTATDCPISDRYIPEIEGLEKKFSAQHVIVWFVYPNVGETSDGIRHHEVDYGKELHVLLDPHHRLVNLTHVGVTPESAILVPEDTGSEGYRVIYHGRIDNRYIQIGEQRPAATQFDLERAIEDSLDHRPVQKADGPSVGCSIIGEP